MSYEPGYQSPKKFSWWLPALAIGIPVVLLVIAMVTIFSAGVIVGLQRHRARTARVAALPPALASLSEIYSTKNGLLTVHYPPDFAAKNLDDSTLMLQRSLPGAHVEVVLAAAIRNPISDDVREFARVLLLSNSKFAADNGGSYREISRAEDNCIPGIHGLRVEGEQTFSTGTVASVSTCFAIHDGHGYEFKTNVPRASAKAELPLLNQILEATELHEP